MGRGTTDSNGADTRRKRTRRSDSALISQVAHVIYERDTSDVTLPDGCWDLVVLIRHSETVVLQTGLITAPVPLTFAAGEEYLCISLKASAFVPTLPGAKTIDQGVPRPLTSARAFWFENERFEVPTFENAEGLIERLAKAGHLRVDELVDGILEAKPKAATLRTLQRRFLQITGLTWKHLEQIHRAQRARADLAAGVDAATVASRCGFSDQAHLIRSMQRFFNQTPREIARVPIA